MQTAAHMLRTGQRGGLFQLQMAFRDLKGSGQRLGLAWSLAWHDIVSRYRGSILGPFWITLSMGLMVLGIGFLYANLFKIPISEFLPFVALGIVFFGAMAGIINEGCETFVQAKGMLSQTSLPMFTFVWRTVLRNLISLAHHLVIVVAVLTYYDYWGVAKPLVALLGVLLMVLNVSWISMLAGIASARFRDIPQIVVSIMQFAIFMTPVFWTPNRFSSEHMAVLHFNPFFHLLDAIRAPLLGDAVSPTTYVVLVAMAAGGWILTFALFARTRRRIVHYL
ncbi:ATP-transporter permease [Phenylobacterium zucineum HLK1]|uniref:ATP-transporter permease n=1 Tax=Phenylobacterium zucineum (strain HLK1) TaxID=450851 RepID=B4REF0_PHEZH|nr:ABC transporter permease [Phenylobacterium zucineum]ACG76892.1 ATP-transporter permease [Phenylobacterium zucineum HLK1]